MQIVFRPRFPTSSEPPKTDRALGRQGQALRESIDALWNTVRAEANRQGFPNAHDHADLHEPDFEEFYENVAMLHAAVSSGSPIFLTAKGLETVPLHCNAAFDPDQPFIVLGATGKSDPLLSKAGCQWPDVPGTRQAERYWEIAAVRDLMGRFCELSHVRGDGDRQPEAHGDDIVGVIARRFAATGCRRFFVKATRPKSGIFHVELPESLVPSAAADSLAAAAEAACLRAMDYEYVRLEGLKGTLMVQPHVEFTREYRIFVVDGHPACGAGVVVHATPLDAAEIRNTWPTYSPMVAEKPSDDVLINDGERYVVENVLPFARDAVGKISADAPDLKHYTLDVGVMDAGDGNGPQMAVVELNPMLNVGLYGLDHERLLESVLHFAGNERALALTP